jgi:hypothetical protein
MTSVFYGLLNSTNAALIIFMASAAAASCFTKSPMKRALAGIAVVLVTLCITISARSLFGWTASAVERPSLPGFVLLVALAISATTVRRIATSAEYRFDAMLLAVGGLVLYPGAMGILDYDTYMIGYSGYLLPAAVALIVAYAIFRGYLLTAVTLNVAIAAFLLGIGESRNFWDYILDPVAWMIGCGAWIVIAVRYLIAQIKPAKVLVPVQPSSGIGETPISH